MQEADALFARIKELTEQGRSQYEAWGVASAEMRIAHWPSGMGDKLHVLIYGDFRPPAEDLRFEGLGITVEAEPRKGTVVHGAPCVLLAKVDITSKDAAGLRDAATRVEALLGAWVLCDWGNSSCHWWSYLTHGSMGGTIGKWESAPAETAAASILKLTPKVRSLVQAALFWIREPRLPLLLGTRSDALAVYAGYWNAFECLVEAVALCRPMQSLSRHEKQRLIDEYLSRLVGNPTSRDVAEMYRTIVDRGFTGKATAALQAVFGSQGDFYAAECFHIQPKGRRLYQIRNDINHGSIDASDPERMLVVEERAGRLKIMVLRLFRAFVEYVGPADPDAPPPA